VILVYDLKHKIIPDGLVYSFIALSLLKLFLFHISYSTFLIPNYLDLLAGPILFLAFFLLWYLSGGRWMGLGDGKLAWGIGWFLGFFGSISAIILGFWIGAGFGIIILVIQKLLASGRKKITMKSEIPFAPFLILGLILVYFFGLDVMGLHSFLNLK
jgi:prepilin signal peptidase PulO-like enzyme (type II secretory pathway)